MLSNVASDAPQQGASTITHAGRQERVPRRHRPRLPLQGAADPLRDDAREPVHQGRDPRALPQHGVLRQQRLRRAGRRRGVLRQDRRPAHVHRGGLPRRAGALAVGLRPDRQPRAQPRPLRPGRRSPRRRRRDDRGRGPGDARHVRDPGACPVAADRPARLPRTYYTEALRDYLLNRSNILGDTFQEREAALYRGGLEIHTTLVPTSSRWPSRPATCSPTRSRASTRRWCRWTRTPGRSWRWSAAAGSCPARTRSTWRSPHARPGRARRRSSSPPPSRPERPPTTSSTATGPACCPIRATRPSRSRSPTPSAASRTRCGR